VIGEPVVVRPEYSPSSVPGTLVAPAMYCADLEPTLDAPCQCVAGLPEADLTGRRSRKKKMRSPG